MTVFTEFAFRIYTYLSYRYSAVNAHGLHSPFLFDFYNEVISPKKEFYFFKRFRALLTLYKKSISTENALFLFRWAAFYKPNSVCLKEANLPVSLALAMPSTTKDLSVGFLKGFTSKDLDILSGLGVLVQESTSGDLCFYEKIDTDSVCEIHNYKCIIVYKPHQTKVKHRLWNNLCTSRQVSISIDLYQFGILLLDKNQAKQHFVIKFS